MKTYIATYHKAGGIDTEEFWASNLKEAKAKAQFYKRFNRGLNSSRTEVKLKRN